MRIIIELDNTQAEPKVQVNNDQGNESFNSPVAMASGAINAGAPKINADNPAISDNTTSTNDVQNVNETAMGTFNDGPGNNAGEAPAQ